jgi:ABC-type glycerol-3-phosphate transport system substrate-binding protein
MPSGNFNNNYNQTSQGNKTKQGKGILPLFSGIFNDNKKAFLFIGLIIIILVLIISLISLLMLPAVEKSEPEVKTITFWTNTVEKEVLADIIANFEEENPFIKVVHEPQIETGYEERIKTRLNMQSPNIGNIVEIDEQWIDEIFLNIVTYNNQEILSRYSNTTILNNTRSNAVFALPFKFDSLALAYNLDHIEEIGFNEESFNRLDWSFLSTRVRNLTKTEKVIVPGQTGPNARTYDRVTRAGIAIGSPQNVRNAVETLQLLLIQNDASFYDEKTQKFVIDEKFTEVIRFYTDFATQNVWREYMDNDIESFTQGEVSIVLAKSSDIDQIVRINPNLRFATTIPARISGIQTISLSRSLVIPRYMPNYSESMKFLEYLSRPDIGYRIFEKSLETRKTFIPAQLESLNKIPRDSKYSVFSDLNPTAQRFKVARYGDVRQAMSQYLIDLYKPSFDNPRPEQIPNFRIENANALQLRLNNLLVEPRR